MSESKNTEMKAQVPAEGILKMHDWGNSKMYLIPCSCTNDDDSIVMEVEADDHGVTVTHYTTQKTDYWTDVVETRYDIENIAMQEAEYFIKDLINSTIRKIKLTWTLWTKGYVKYQCTTIMTEQQALNYAETLKSAMKDSREFHNQRMKK